MLLLICLILTGKIFPISSLLPLNITDVICSDLPKVWVLSSVKFSTKTLIILFSYDLFFCSFDFQTIYFEFFLIFPSEIFLSIKSKSAATVPGLGLKIKEYEFIKFTLLIRLKCIFKILPLGSPGYPIIKSLENSILELIFFQFIKCILNIL